MFKMISPDEVSAFRRFIFSTPPDRLPCPKNWPPRCNPEGAFDASVPWAKYRRAHGRDEAPVYPSKYGKSGSDLLDKLKGLLGDECTEEELLELDAAFAAQADMREKMRAGDEGETAAEKDRLEKEHTSGGESVEPEWRRRLRDFLKQRNIADDTEIDELFNSYNRLPKPATEGGMGGRLAPGAPMASDRKMAALYGAHIATIIGEAPRAPDRSTPRTSSAGEASALRMFPDIARIGTM